jgi:GNAT superfamily N-acetyltransferase
MAEKKFPIHKHTLKDGSQVFLQNVTKSTSALARQLIIDGFQYLSPYSIRQRFLGQKKGFTDNELSYLTEVDNTNHVAIGAVAHYKGKDTGVGIARFVRSLSKGNQAEFAILVIDPFQGVGLGKILFEALIAEAKRCEINILTGTIESGNHRLYNLLGQYTQIKIVGRDQEIIEIECSIN